MMEPLDQLQRLFRKFGVYITDIQMDQEPIDISYHNNKIKFSMKTVFYSTNNILEMAKLAEKIESEEEEVQIRQNYPAVQRAYEEYQILLKLSK